MMNDPKMMRWLWIGCALEITGLLLGIISAALFHRITMTLFFVIGIPMILLGMVCYIVTVIRVIISKGAF
ncbi:MAG: hypothetical protein HY538_05095 [Deltaproteobacteria bacterium]|nr:hypothetical protein [Deltaproteobacteria bacterium]